MEKISSVVKELKLCLKNARVQDIFNYRGLTKRNIALEKPTEESLIVYVLRVKNQRWTLQNSYKELRLKKVDYQDVKEN